MPVVLPSSRTGAWVVAENLNAMDATPEFQHLERDRSHELREALTLSKGWLQAVLRNWKDLEDHEREAMVTAALFGTNRIAFVLDVMEGNRLEAITPPSERIADDLERISDSHS